MSSNNPIDTSILPAFRPAVTAQASLMLNPKYQVMEVQSRFRTYEAPRVLVKPFSLERGFAGSLGEDSTAGKLNGSGLYDLSVDNGVNNENSSWGW